MIAKITKQDILAAVILFLLPLILFAPVTLGSKTLLPADNRFTFEPYASFAAELGVEQPHNLLVSDLILENYVWKDFIREAIAKRELPLWNPYIFAGQPFLANGQHSALYPFSILFYTLPLEKAYGWFTVIQLWLAGLFTYAFLRSLKAGYSGALLAGVAFSLSGFFINRVVFTMILAAALWLPLVLTMIEIIIRKQEEKGTAPYSPIPYLLVGSLAMGAQVLAGHIEITYYTLLISAFYAAWRLIILWRAQKTILPALRLSGWLMGMMLLGLGLGAVQFIPFYEIGSSNFREGAASLAQVRGWALPYRRIISFIIPNFFGSPAHHGYFDILSKQWLPLGLNAHGQLNPLCPNCTGWDTKTAVEAGAYVGILPLVLAFIATFQALKEQVGKWAGGKVGRWESEKVSRGENTGSPAHPHTRTPAHRHTCSPAHLLFFAVLALLSLLFAFGTPLYAVLFYGLPGWNQLHSPFRWIYPFTFSIAVLAGLGVEQVSRWAGGKVSRWESEKVSRGERETVGSEANTGSPAHPLTSTPAHLLFRGGLVGTLLMLTALITPAPFIKVGQFALDHSGLAQNAFADGRQFIGYQWPNFLKFFLMVMASGAVLRLARCPIYLPIVNRKSEIVNRAPIWKPLAIIIVALDLMLAGADFNPASDPALLNFTPPAIEWLHEQQAEDPFFRITSFDTPDGRGNKILNANTAMAERLFDVRGYDSVISAQYAQFMQLIQKNGDLLYNRIGPIYHPGYAALDSALLDLPGVRYVLATEEIPNPGYQLVYNAEIKIYENLDRLPRAFIVTEAETGIQDMDFALRSLNPREKVLLDGEQINPGRGLSPEDNTPLSRARPDVSITEYTLNQVAIAVRLDEPGWLVLADSYFPGWKAYAQSVNGEETEITIHRANGNFRAVYLPAGQWTVRFKYAPMSFKLGIYVSFLAIVVLLMLLAYWTWGKIYRESDEDAAIKRIAKNSIAPMVMALGNRLIDFAFALLMLRILEPEGVGRYAFAVSLITLFEILTRFGLGTLLTREVAKDHSDGNKYLSNVVLLRGALWLIAIPLIGAALGIYYFTGNMTADIVYTVALFVLGLFMSNIADALTALFYAYEKAEYPAFIATITTVTRVALGALVLLAGWGIIGLAGVSVVANTVSVLVLAYIFLRKIFRPHYQRNGTLQRKMLGESWPLMINHLLATIFFRIDVFILKPTWGDDAVGYYNAAYKYIDGINIIPQYFTLAIFPLMSRYAQDSKESLVRAYILSLRLLQMLAIPVAVATPFIAEDLILILGGRNYLPQSKIALQLLIWFLPFSFINQVTQYVLISINQQRFLTRAFIIGVSFNIVANLLLIPRYGYQAAAITTILSEWSLLIPFYYAVRKHLCHVPWLDVLWRPAIAALTMGAAIWPMRAWSPLIFLPIGGIIYFAVLWLAGGFRQPDMDFVWSALPGRRMTNDE
ncbi:MAG TPA: oligosaccharide flippase family protein [Chloroflexi bacterium]|nr:oligosaccharide flippase family protein [Chloroflexota bacterium]